MDSANVQDLYNEWQSAVRAHEGLVRDGRMRGLTMAEIEEIGTIYVLRIDTAFTRLKNVEAQQATASAACQSLNPASGEALLTI